MYKEEPNFIKIDVCSLKYFKEEAKGKINGTIMGVKFEWLVHNVAYQGLSVLKHLGINNLFGRDIIDQAKDVDLGKTIFDDNHGWIDINENNQEAVEIKESWFLKNPISNFVFTALVRDSEEYKNNYYNDNNKRGLWDMWLELEVHNIVGDIALPTAVTISPIDLLCSSGGDITKSILKLFKRAFSAYMENKEDWFKL